MYFQDILQGIASNLMDSNLFQLKNYISRNIQVGACNLGIFTDIFSSICGTFFLGIPDRQLNLGHMCFSVKMSRNKMLNVDKVRANLNSLNIMDIIWPGNRLGDQKAKLFRENQQPSEALLTVLALINEQILDRFELIRIILMAIPETMDKINKT